MSAAAVSVDSASVKSQSEGRSLWQDAWRRLKKDRFAMVCLTVVVCYALMAVLVKLGLVAASWGQTVGGEYQAPSFANWKLWFGTDIFGRSVVLKTIF